MQKTILKRRKQILILTTILVIGAAYLFLLPRLFQLSWVQQKLHTSLSTRIHGTVSWEGEKLTLFPLPGIHFYHVSVESEEKFSGTLDRVSIFPAVFAILRGDLNIARLSVTGIDTTVELPERQTPLSLETATALLREHLDDWMPSLEARHQKKLRVDIENAALTLTRAGRPLFACRDMDGTFSWQRPAADLSLAVTTDLWHRSSLELHLDAAAGTHSGRWTLEQFTLATAWESLFSGAPLQVEKGIVDATVSWDTPDFKTWHISTEVTDPDIAFRREERRFDLRGRRVAGEATIDSGGVHITLSEMDLDSPGFSLTGQFDLDRDTPSVGWQIDIKDADLASTREAALFFADRFKTTRRITDVLRAGRVPQVTMGQKADTPKGLKKLPSFYLHGSLERSDLHIPNTELLLTETTGAVTLEGGTLTATDIRTRLGNSTGSGGQFTLWLRKEDPRSFKVSCDIEADMAQLPPLLERLVKNETFSREMAGISSAEGSAAGSLMLEKTGEDLQVTVAASRFDLSAAYHRIPYPLVLSGDGFDFQAGAVRVRDMGGSIGESTLSALTAAVTWEPTLQLDISSGTARVDTGELAAWLGDILPSLRTEDGTPACRGQLAIDALHFNGPLATPGAWRLQADGAIAKEITVGTPLLSPPLTVHAGRFTATQERIELFDADASFLGTRLAADSALTDYLTPAPWTVDTLVMGRLNQAVSDWICQRGHVPEALRWRVPLTAAPIAFQWRENGEIRISGQVADETGIQLAIDMEKGAEALAVHRLTLHDGKQNAAATLDWRRDSLEVSFSGNLSGSSLSALMADNRLLSGAFQGDFRANFNRSTPYLNSFQGRLQTDGLDVTPTGLPLTVEHLALTGEGKAFDIQTARFTWEGAPLSAFGQIERTGPDLQLDVTITGDDIEWDAIRALMEMARTRDADRSAPLLGEIRFSCNRLSLTPDLVFETLEGRVALATAQTDVVFQNAEMCGISLPGTVSLTADRARFSFQPAVVRHDIEPTVTCLQGSKTVIDGSYDLSGDLTFDWDLETPFAQALGGNLSFTAEKGRIYKAVLFGKLFSLVNFSEFFSGEFPDLEKDGFPYKTALFSGKFSNGRFELESGVIDSSAMKLFFEGSEDLIRRQHDLTIVVAPLKAVDAVVDKIPVISDVLEKGLVIYPIKVTGSWEDPQMALVSPSAVGGEMLGIIQRTLKLPVTLFEKLFPDKKNSGGDPAEE